MTKPSASDVAQMLDRSRHLAGLYDLAADTVADLIAERDRLIVERDTHAHTAEQVRLNMAWDREQHARNINNLRAQYEQSSRNASDVATAYEAVARRVYAAARSGRKTLRIADVLDGLPMVTPV